MREMGVIIIFNGLNDEKSNSVEHLAFGWSVFSTGYAESFRENQLRTNGRF
jgi:hypothetical protein